MGAVLTDADFTATTFVVIDFETLTPAGQPPCAHRSRRDRSGPV